MDWTLELVVVPVSDIDRAKAFYADQVGFRVDVDHSAGDFRVVQLSPPGSACSIALLRNTEMAPGTLHGLHLIVPDIEAARAQLVEHGVDASEPFHFRRERPAARDRPEPRQLRDLLHLRRSGWQRVAGPARRPSGESRRLRGRERP
jgi:predicted enzyme related to lactoylglutathione lyase